MTPEGRCPTCKLWAFVDGAGTRSARLRGHYELGASLADRKWPRDCTGVGLPPTELRWPDGTPYVDNAPVRIQWPSGAVYWEGA